MTLAALASEQARLGAEPICPFPGLRSFTEAEAKYYFGREDQRDECIRLLQEKRFLAVIGSSGSGKSSLVCAGVLHELNKGLLRGADEHWDQVVLRPGPDPMASLVRALVRRFGGETRKEEIEEKLRGSSRGLAEAVTSLRTANAANHVLIVVDQFEELFRLGKEQQTPERWQNERTTFVRLLLGARSAPNVPVYTIITMRTDFLENCTRFPGLAEALNAGQFLVPELTREQLEKTIVKPVERVGGAISRALVRRVLGDATNVPDALPVIQHALMRTWHHWRKRISQGNVANDTAMGLTDYEAIGELRSALNLHGNEILKQLVSENATEYEESNVVSAVRILFQRITLTNADDKVTRSPTAFETLVRLGEELGIVEPEATLRRIVNAFRADDSRFLMPPAAEELSAETEIDIAHEAVFRTWEMLRGRGGDVPHPGWIAEEHVNGRCYARLAEAARLKRRGEGQFLIEELLVHTRDWWTKFQPKAEWASRYHVLDSSGQAIVEKAKERLLEIDRMGSGSGAAAARNKAYAEYREELRAWHREQFEQSERFLAESVACKQAEVAAKEAREREAIEAKEAALEAREAEVEARQLAQRAELDAQEARARVGAQAFRSRLKNWIILTAAIAAAVLGVLLVELQQAHGTAADLQAKVPDLERRAREANDRVARANDRVASANQLAQEATRQEQRALANQGLAEAKLRETEKARSAKDEELRKTESKLVDQTQRVVTVKSQVDKLSAEKNRLLQDKARIAKENADGSGALEKCRGEREAQHALIDKLRKEVSAGKLGCFFVESKDRALPAPMP
jgi:hypothetical protein